MPASTFDKTKALQLYHQHKTDTEIAKEVGSYTGTIRSWRNREGLTNISPNAKPKASYPGANGGMDYRLALDPEKANAMNKFLRAVLWAGGKAKEAGIKPDVGNFIKAWIGLPVTEEGKRVRRQGSSNARQRQQRRLKHGPS